MKILDVEQGSEAWLLARLGIPTASEFRRLITATGQPSKQSDAYANELVAEWLTGQPAGADLSDKPWVARGKEMEAEAAAWYQFTQGVEIAPVGFCKHDDHEVGCSPDRLVGDDGLLEIKAPAPHTLVGYLLADKLPADYKAQVQGQLWITGRLWCDFLAFHPQFPKQFLVRVGRNERYIKKLNEAVSILTDKVAERKAALSEKGISPMSEAA